MTSVVANSSERIPAQLDGAQLVAELSQRYPDADWLAALAKGAVMSRSEVDGHINAGSPLPDRIVQAVQQIEDHLSPPDPADQSNVFAAQTNDDAAQMEVDGEAGLTVLPGARPNPSKSDSIHSMGQRRERDVDTTE